MRGPRTSLSEADTTFIELFERGGAALVMQELGGNERNAYARRKRLQLRIGRSIDAPGVGPRKNMVWAPESHPERLQWDIRDGVVIVGSDAHFWPGIVSTAHRAFVHYIKELKPRAVIMNGDVLDGAKVSRHPSIGWEDKPSIAQEIEAANERLAEIMDAAGRRCQLAWTLGNHDSRLESRIATVAPELAKLKGVHLKDHFPLRYEPCWSAWINNDVVVKHRFKSGVHAPHNNAMWAGKTMVTGHLHSLKVQPLTDYNGTRFGVDTGTLADIFGPQFDYCEDNPRSWRSGFAVLTFHKGKLLWPEVVHVIGEGEVEFRGQVIRV